MKNIIAIIAIAFSSVGMAAIFGKSVEAGLFGSIIAVGIYAAESKGRAA